MQVDDDSYVHVDALLNLLSSLPSQHLYLGNIDEGPGGPHRDPASPWYVTEEEWASQHYPMWAHGAGYVLSKVRALCFPLPLSPELFLLLSTADSHTSLKGEPCCFSSWCLPSMSIVCH